MDEASSGLLAMDEGAPPPPPPPADENGVLCPCPWGSVDGGLRIEEDGAPTGRGLPPLLYVMSAGPPPRLREEVPPGDIDRRLP